jgi:hypothetical protein
MKEAWCPERGVVVVVVVWKYGFENARFGADVRSARSMRKKEESGKRPLSAFKPLCFSR